MRYSGCGRSAKVKVVKSFTFSLLKEFSNPTRSDEFAGEEIQCPEVFLLLLDDVV